MANPSVEAVGGTAVAVAAGGGLMTAMSQWELAVQAGAVGVAIVLAWVVYRLWQDNKQLNKEKDDLHRAKEDLYKKWIELLRQDADEEKKFAQSFVEEVTKSRQALEAVSKLQQENATRLAENHKRLEIMERNCAKQ